jgi:hypothetical protein
MGRDKKDSLERRVGKAVSLIWDISLFEYALVFITVFLAALLLLAVFGISIFHSFAPAAAAVVITYLARRARTKTGMLEKIEKGNPLLKDSLRAAYDNRKKDNLIVRELVRDVSYNLEDLQTDSYLSLRRTNFYVITSIILVFLILGLMFIGFEGLGLTGFFGGGGGGNGDSNSNSQGNGAGGGGAEGSGETPESQDTSIGTGGPQDIYGDVSIARIDGNEMDLEIHPEYGEGTEIADSEDPGSRAAEIQDGFIQATAAESYVENIPAELEGAVKRYFEKLSGE